jgi:L-threonine kinase
MVGVALALGYTISPAELARLACQIEPSDSTMFTNLTILAYRGSARYRELGPVPALPLLMLDAGPAIDTVRYNARLDLTAVRRLAPTTQTTLALLEQGLNNHEAEAIGAAATLSALSYQVINTNPLIDQAIKWATDTGALGLVRAHSGSVIGLLYPAQTELSDYVRWLSNRFAGRLWLTQLTQGSYHMVDHQPYPQPLEVSSVL